MLLASWVHSLFSGLFIFLFIFISLLLILIVLIQKGRGGGLANAFGGAGGNTAFGSKTGDVLTWATSIMFGIFLILAVALNLMGRIPRQDVALPLPGASTPAENAGQNKTEDTGGRTSETRPATTQAAPVIPAATRGAATIPATIPAATQAATLTPAIPVATRPVVATPPATRPATVTATVATTKPATPATKPATRP